MTNHSEDAVTGNVGSNLTRVHVTLYYEVPCWYKPSTTCSRSCTKCLINS